MAEVLRKTTPTPMAQLMDMKNRCGHVRVSASENNEVKSDALVLEKLEQQIAELSARVIGAARKKDWRRTVGIFQNDPDFEEAVRLGREYREQQTYEREIAGS